MAKRIDTAVILAAGRGTRLKPFTNDIPKGFVKIGAETLIERSVRLLKSNGIRKIIIGTGHLSEKYENFAHKHGIITYKNPDFATTGSFHTLCCGEKLITDDFLLLESDLLYQETAIQSLLGYDADDVILCSGFTESNDEVYVEKSEDGRLRNLSKQRSELRSVDAELVGIWKISKSLFDKLLVHNTSANDAMTKDYERAIADIANNHSVKVLKIDDLVWCEIDNEEHLERANREIFPRL